MKKKLLALLLTVAMILTLTAPAFAAAIFCDLGDSRVEVSVEGPIVMPRDIFVVNKSFSGDSFMTPFACAPANGNRMNLTVVNNGTTEIIVNIVDRGTTLPSWRIAAGKSGILPFISNDPLVGLSDEGTISITTSTGANMSGTIQAWQYWEN